MKIKALCLMFLALLFLSACSGAQEQPVNTEGKAADFTLETLEGKQIVLSKILKRKAVVLDFWASWCPYCVKIMPDLEKFYKENQDKVTVIGVNIREGKEKVARLVKDKGISYPVVLDSDGKVAQLYKVRGIPAVFFVDKDSNILYRGHSAQEIMERVKF